MGKSKLKYNFVDVESHAAVYEDCEFKIVHPDLDDPAEHYSWKHGVAISVNNDSTQAKESIRIFELDSEERTRARAKQRNQERIEIFFNISNEVKERVLSVLRFKI